MNVDDFFVGFSFKKHVSKAERGVDDFSYRYVA